MGYSVERRESVLKKMLPPNNVSIAALSKEEGISDATLYLWRKQAREQGRLMPDSDTTPNGWTSRDKFSAVMETAPKRRHNMSLVRGDNRVVPMLCLACYCITS